MNFLLLIIGVIALGFGVFLCTRGDTHGGFWKEPLGGAMTVASIMIIFVMFVVLMLKSDTYSSFEKNYKRTVYSIENYNIENDNGLFILNAILNDVDNLNEQIETNKKNWNNVFYGCLYNKKIGEFEPINIENFLKNDKEE